MTIPHFPNTQPIQISDGEYDLDNYISLAEATENSWRNPVKKRTEKLYKYLKNCFVGDIEDFYQQATLAVLEFATTQPNPNQMSEKDLISYVTKSLKSQATTMRPYDTRTDLTEYEYPVEILDGIRVAVGVLRDSIRNLSESEKSELMETIPYLSSANTAYASRYGKRLQKIAKVLYVDGLSYEDGAEDVYDHHTPPSKRIEKLETDEIKLLFSICRHLKASRPSDKQQTLQRLLKIDEAVVNIIHEKLDE